MNTFFKKKNLVLFFLNIPYAIDPTRTSLHQHTKLQSGIRQPMCHIQPIFWVTHQKLRSCLFFKDPVDPMAFLSPESKYVAQYVMYPLASGHLGDGHFSDTLCKNKFGKVICLARSSTVESVKVIRIALLQKLISAAAGFGSKHYFKLFCQTKSLPDPNTFCQLIVATRQDVRRLDNHSLFLHLGRATWSFLRWGDYGATSEGNRKYSRLI